MLPKNAFVNIGLTALGALGIGFGFAIAADEPGPSPAPTVLALYDGRIYRGTIAVDDTGYSVRQNGGVLRFRKELVEGTFGSVLEVYRFKAERLPARDPDERLKLARWCLGQRLNAEAKAQLLAVLELSPGNLVVKNMIANIDNAAQGAALRDEALQRTRGELRLPAAGIGPPAELDPSIVHSGPAAAAVSLAYGGLPAIFDLPTPLAIKRADEFNQTVHPILQRACARCHNENHKGDFQLIEVKNPRQYTANVGRANLEATLGLIDRESLARSELLTRGLVPHGPYKRPIFTGATDPGYKRIETWVKNLRNRPAADQAAASRFGSGASDSAPASASSESDGFAIDRVRPPVMPEPMAVRPESLADGRPQPPATPNPVVAAPPGRLLPGSGSGTQPYAAPDTEFPVPYMMGGPRPKPPATPAATAVAPPAQVPGQPPPVAEDGLPPLPGAATAAAAAPTPAAAAPTAAKPPRKPVKLDPALLERALMNKYAPH
jgi:hypothetical protein